MRNESKMSWWRARSGESRILDAAKLKFFPNGKSTSIGRLTPTVLFIHVAPFTLLLPVCIGLLVGDSIEELLLYVIIGMIATYITFVALSKLSNRESSLWVPEQLEKQVSSTVGHLRQMQPSIVRDVFISRLHFVLRIAKSGSEKSWDARSDTYLFEWAEINISHLDDQVKRYAESGSTDLLPKEEK